LVALIEEAIELTRDLSRQLDPVELKAGKLADHFEDLAAGMSQRFKVTCQFEDRLVQTPEDPAVATHLYRIAQEAVIYAVKCGRAGRISIGLDSAPDEIVLTITDDGPGVRETAPNDADAGVRAMVYRADLIGATLNIERLAPRGKRVICIVPFSAVPNATKN
jgi:signal transduction histidine kinase